MHACNAVGPALVARLLLAATLCAASARADDWPTWRGPALDGVAKGAGYPVSWGPEQHVVWRQPLPGLGASTPAIWGDHVVVTCTIDGKDAVVCLDRAGKERWRQTLGEAKAGKHKKATGANPSPVTDGKRAWVYFKSGELASLDLATGAVAWRTNLQEKFGADTLWWDLGTSPVLSDKGVIVAVMQSGPSYVASFDRATGELLWKHDRMLDAPEEAAQSYSTPIVARGLSDKGEPAEVLFVLGADHVTAHDAASGRELWRVGGLNPKQNGYFRSIASPVLAGDLVIAPYARGSTITAIRRGGSGDVTASHVAWARTDLGSDVPTPAVKDGRVVFCTDKGVVEALEADTGRTAWRRELAKNRNAYSSSPVVADGRVIVTREDGHSFVLGWPAAGAEAETVGEGDVGEMTVATPVCVDGRIYLRTHDSLWCIGEK
jgi:outer membrane protein assembly factor BamB